ncbi:hypothetical protein B0H11DRAFT_1931960 [Mycena galericulata]|nr:hypothetical protein B0H11DRAFT_1931960 [Mycena galericulata]
MPPSLEPRLNGVWAARILLPWIQLITLRLEDYSSYFRINYSPPHTQLIANVWVFTLLSSLTISLFPSSWTSTFQTTTAHGLTACGCFHPSGRSPSALSVNEFENTFDQIGDGDFLPALESLALDRCLTTTPLQAPRNMLLSRRNSMNGVVKLKSFRLTFNSYARVDPENLPHELVGKLGRESRKTINMFSADWKIVRKGLEKDMVDAKPHTALIFLGDKKSNDTFVLTPPLHSKNFTAGSPFFDFFTTSAIGQKNTHLLKSNSHHFPAIKPSAGFGIIVSPAPLEDPESNVLLEVLLLWPVKAHGSRTSLPTGPKLCLIIDLLVFEAGSHMEVLPSTVLPPYTYQVQQGPGGSTPSTYLPTYRSSRVSYLVEMCHSGVLSLRKLAALEKLIADQFFLPQDNHPYSTFKKKTLWDRPYSSTCLSLPFDILIVAFDALFGVSALFTKIERVPLRVGDEALSEFHQKLLALSVVALWGVFTRFLALFGVAQPHNQNVKSLMLGTGIWTDYLGSWRASPWMKHNTMSGPASQSACNGKGINARELILLPSPIGLIIKLNFPERLLTAGAQLYPMTSITGLFHN